MNRTLRAERCWRSSHPKPIIGKAIFSVTLMAGVIAAAPLRAAPGEVPAVGRATFPDLAAEPAATPSTAAEPATSADPAPARTLFPRAAAPAPAATNAAPPEAHDSSWRFVPRREPSRFEDRDDASREPADAERKHRRRWLLLAEGITRVPIDVGVQGVIQAPMGLRLIGGYGWVPHAYIGPVAGAAALASGDPLVATVLENGLERGQSWHFGVGIQPFDFGLYLDVGYSRLDLSGSLDPAEVRDSLPLAQRLDVGMQLSAWTAELGYQGLLADRVSLAIAIGAAGTLSANTRIQPESGSSTNEMSSAASEIDAQLERRGILPTITLRLGLNLI